MRPTVRFCLTVSCALIVLALQAQNPPEISSQDTPLTFSGHLNLVSVPVVVRDREGRAVGGLKAEDFRLIDKGKAQIISKFALQKAEPITALVNASLVTRGSNPSLPAPERYTAYLVDDVHLKPQELINIRKAMKQHLDGALRASDRAAIFTTAGVVVADFTGDREKLTRALDSVQPWTNGADSICPGITYFMADVLVNRSIGPHNNPDDTYGVKSNAVRAAKECGAATQDQAIALWDQIEQRGRRESQLALGATEDVVRRLSAMPGNRTLVMVSGGFVISPALRAAEQDASEKAIRADIAVNTIDARALWTRGDDISIQGSPVAGYEIVEADEMAESLAELAINTGGKFFHEDSDLKNGFDQLAARPEYLYVLGFSPEDLKFDGTYHSLRVTVAGATGASIQARRGYWAPEHAVDTAEAAQEQLEEDVFSREEIKDIPIDLHTEFVRSSPARAELTVKAQVNPDQLRFEKLGDRSNDKVTIVTGLFDDSGNYLSGIQRVLDMRLKDKTLASLRDAGISVEEKFHLAPGRYVVRLVVQDAGGQTTAARSDGVEIP